ncbi:hypothetical protein [Methylomonas koyamae]|uniref:hypothetical protein n=1 Tax=Methylomonas koyamae TaxID=702114 RepID=UPI0028739606|nr:hypothetical protein [Methylomonas koyamae]WNB75737.1 hypothetical protein RI210_21070 [Methylomonas koyamae]
MFRLLAIALFCLSFSGVAAAHEDWGHGRHHGHHHQHYRHHHGPYRPAYLPPRWGYQRVPPRYHALPPPRDYRHDRHAPYPDYDYRRGW